MKISATKVREFLGHRDAIYTMTLNETGCISAGADGYIVEWKWDEEDGVLLAKEEEAIYGMAWHRGLNKLLIGTRKGHVLVLDCTSKKIEKRIEAHKGGIFGFLVLKDHSYISYGEDGRVCHWTMNHELCGQEKVSEKSVRCGVFINHEQIFFGTSDHTITIFDVKAFRKVYHWEAHGNSVFSLAASGQTLYSVGRDALLKCWKLEDCTLQGEVPAHMYSIHGLDLNAERNLLLTSSMDKTIKIWDAENLNLLKVIDHERYESHTNCVNKVLWIDSNRFISCSDDRKICLFNIEISDERE